MGANSFFSMLADKSPLFHALHLPGVDKYSQSQNRAAINNSNGTTPYGGVAPSLAGANAGYTAGGPGANPNAYVQAARGAVAPPMGQQQRPVGMNATWQQGQVSPMQSY
jgi:hypothetical protein